MSRIALTLAFLFLLWRLFAPAEPEIAYEDQAAVLATSNPVTPGLDPAIHSIAAHPAPPSVTPGLTRGPDGEAAR